MKAGALNPHTGRDFVQFGKTESVLNKGAKKIALLFNPPPVLSLEIIHIFHKFRKISAVGFHCHPFYYLIIPIERYRVPWGILH